MRRICCFLLALPLCAVCGHARADTILDFALSGAFQSGGTISGILSIDTTSGLVTNGDFVLDADGLDLTIDSPPRGQGPDLGSYYQVNYPETIGSPQYNLLLTIPQVSLVGYTGGPLCTYSQGTSGGCIASVESILIRTDWPMEGVIQGDDLVSGSLSLAQAPEPASLALMGTGLLAALGLLRRRARTAAV